jgi:putative ABC transport system ATP-binding protein
MTDALSLKMSPVAVGNAGTVDILHDISLTAAKGETGLVGPSGSGKSSPDVDGGLETASSGSIIALGTDITHFG